MQSKVVQPKFALFCIACGRPTECNHHLVFGRGLRELCENDGLKAPMCDRCHNIGKLTERVHDNEMAEKLSKMLGQAIFERNELAEGKAQSIDEAREHFRSRYGRAYF